ncbi:DUF1289 domain-containing protein [Aureimonas pseudogalii]|uniref:DUF1289 domain-containing protein n=1 Tax=Aureimonas pseudogalii TaxID=1744844 RepID=A0A7W6EDT0_9HYPH|nr:DUF1289 domain-containing protein [Aureimonas pseudogalii]MBB3998201.1 hypothetical protein [Aureimonas pseudogalii]
MTALSAAAVPSPCIALCVLDTATGWCRGCGRTIEEIMAWGGASDIRKAEILADLPARLAAPRPLGGSAL